MKTTPHSAKQAQIGWQIAIGGQIRTVKAKRKSPPIADGEDRRLTMWFEETPVPMTGEENQTIWRVEE